MNDYCRMFRKLSLIGYLLGLRYIILFGLWRIFDANFESPIFRHAITSEQ